MIKKLETMLKLQDEMNSTINPEWRSAGNPWNEAIFVETGELIEHHGFKWWKKEVPDMAQVRLEVVDIFHFLLSGAIEDLSKASLGITYKGIAKQLTVPLANVEYDKITAGIKTTAMRLANSVNELGYCQSFQYFWQLLFKVGMTFDELFDMYVGKNLLNIFRQQNGYKEGTYIKEWFGEEDNVYLAKVLESVPDDVDYMPTYVLDKLTEQYQKVCG